VKEPAIGQRSIRTASFMVKLELILRSGKFLRRKLGPGWPSMAVLEPFRQGGGAVGTVFDMNGGDLTQEQTW
jgi:hypothetical protein